MSLERKIEELTNAVNLLTAALNNGTPQVATTQVDEVAPTEAPVQKAEQTEVLKTHDDLKQVCLTVARAGKKAEVKDVLKSYGAVKAVEVAVELIEECIGKLEAI